MANSTDEKRGGGEEKSAPEDANAQPLSSSSSSSSDPSTTREEDSPSPSNSASDNDDMLHAKGDESMVAWEGMTTSLDAAGRRRSINQPKRKLKSEAKSKKVG